MNRERRGLRRWAVLPLLAVGLVLIAGCSSEVGGQAAQVTTAARASIVPSGAGTTALPPSPQVTLSGPAGTTGPGPSPEPPTSGPAPTSAPLTAPPTVTLPPSSTVTVVVTASSEPVVTTTAPRSTVTAVVTRTGGNGGATHTWSQWKSPTGNIACLIGGGEVRCDINEMDFSAPKPSSCNGVPKAIAMVANQAPAFRCISDTVADPGSPVLAYGDSTHAESFTCISQQDGMHCSDDNSGHSFRLARGSYDLN